MSKLPSENKFFDLSDYARIPAQIVVDLLIKTKANSIFYTSLFFLCGMSAAFLIYEGTYLKTAGVLIILKSMFDAADGEVARKKNRPSYIGRYFDSICDFFVNVMLLGAIGYSSGYAIYVIAATLILFQLQGSLYNYYYVIKRYQCQGDRTSRIDESKMPEPFPWDNPRLLVIFHNLFQILYGWQDRFIQLLDRRAQFTDDLPNWFLTLVSVLGLGFQLLVISICLFFNELQLVPVIFLGPFTAYMILLIVLRKLFLH